MRFDDLGISVEDSGVNFSLGQRQLICLARALLRSAKIVILDEATASIDLATDQTVQSCVSKLSATVITIAHRLSSIVDYDKVLVLDQGQIQQFGHPWELMQEDGMFRKLCEDDGNLTELQRVAESAWQSTGSKS